MNVHMFNGTTRRNYKAKQAFLRRLFVREIYQHHHTNIQRKNTLNLLCHKLSFRCCQVKR